MTHSIEQLKGVLAKWEALTPLSLNEANAFRVEPLARELIAAYEAKEWVETSDRLPENPDTTRYSCVECYVVVDGEIRRALWNCQHEVWDDMSGDDFLFEPQEPSHWMKTPDTPTLPTRKDV